MRWNSDMTGFECSPSFVILRLLGFLARGMRPAIGRLSLSRYFIIIWRVSQSTLMWKYRCGSLALCFYNANLIQQVRFSKKTYPYSSSHLPHRLHPLHIGRLPHISHCGPKYGLYRYSPSISKPKGSRRLNIIGRQVWFTPALKAISDCNLFSGNLYLRPSLMNIVPVSMKQNVTSCLWHCSDSERIQSKLHGRAPS